MSTQPTLITVPSRRAASLATANSRLGAGADDGTVVIGIHWVGGVRPWVTRLKPNGRHSGLVGSR